MSDGHNIRAPAPEVAHPDFTICSGFFGFGLVAAECYTAADDLPDIDVPFPYFTSPPLYNMNPLLELPFSINHGTNCYISVEAAGPTIPHPWSIVPRDIRILATQTIQKCVIRGFGTGGYSTYQIGNLFAYLSVPTNQFGNPLHFPSSTAFLTLTVSVVERKLSKPGDTDQSIRMSIVSEFSDMEMKVDKTIQETPSWRSQVTQFFGAVIYSEMTPGRSPWWIPYRAQTPEALAASNKMTYECDALLGAPPAVDCDHIEWSELAPDSDTLSVAPGVVTFLHQNSCYLAVAASTALTLTWQQVRVALDTLLHACVENPVTTSTGGRAFYGAPKPPLGINGIFRNRRRDEVTILNALPPAVNLTVFQQTEPWTSVMNEMASCTWKAVQNRVSVTSCTTA